MVAYVSTADGIDHEQLAGGFFADWPVKPSPERHLELLRGSYAVELAVDEGKVIGFVTATSDGVLSAYIPLLEVLPEYQGRGIGSDLIKRLLLRLDGLYMIDLSCDGGLEAFYDRLGSACWIEPWECVGARTSSHRRGLTPRLELSAQGTFAHTRAR